MDLKISNNLLLARSGKQFLGLGPDPNQHQKLNGSLLMRHPAPQKNFIDNFSSYPVNRQTNKEEDEEFA